MTMQLIERNMRASLIRPMHDLKALAREKLEGIAYSGIDKYTSKGDNHAIGYDSKADPRKAERSYRIALRLATVVRDGAEIGSLKAKLGG